MNFFQTIDDAVLKWVQANLQSPMLQYTFRDITSLGGDTLAVLFTLFVTGALWATGNRKPSAVFLGTMLLTAGVIVGLKLAIGRPCPLAPDPYQHHHGDFPTSIFSVHLPCMPSGHTCGSTTLYGLILFLVRDITSNPTLWGECPRWRRWATVWLIALPIVIAVSRIVLSAHWLSDVIVGYALGWAILLLSRWLQLKVLT